jgi:group I intron endonuclease
VPAIYQIVNRLNGKFYVGRAVRPERRWAVHLCKLRAGIHHARHLQHAWNKYGEAAFEFRIVRECEQGELVACEQAYLDDPAMRGRLYNRSLNAKNSGDPSVETRAKMSASAKRRPPPSETTLRKRSAALKGRKKPARSDEARARYRAAALRAWQRPEVRARNVAATRAAQTTDWRARLAEGQRHRFADPEERRKHSDAHRGHVPSIAARQKASESLTRYTADPAVRERRRQLALAQWAKRREEARACQT